MKSSVLAPTALFLDLDGTLLDQESRISVRVRHAVRAAAQLVPVAIASGREPDDVSHFARLLGLSCPQVADNGARIIDPVTGRTLHEKPMSAAAARRVVEHLEARRLKYYAVDAGRVARSASEFTEWRVTVIAAHANDRATCERLLADLDGAGVLGVASTDARGTFWYANFSESEASKGYGARYFAGVSGVDLRGAIAVGDSHNDLPMFAAVGTAVAMGHARPEVRAAAAHTVGSVGEDGVAEAIERFIL